MNNNLSLDDFHKREFNEKITPEKKLTKLPNSTTVLVLGIISIAVCMIGFITGSIALVLAHNDLKSYNKDPDSYDENSYKNITAGKTCAIIGICISVVSILIYLLYFFLILSVFDSFSTIMKNAIEQQNMQME